MKKSQFTEVQIVNAIKAHESGRKAEDICRELSITPAAFTSGGSATGVWKLLI